MRCWAKLINYSRCGTTHWLIDFRQAKKLRDFGRAIEKFWPLIYASTQYTHTHHLMLLFLSTI
jgi:hypothetical protein